LPSLRQLAQVHEVRPEDDDDDDDDESTAKEASEEVAEPAEDLEDRGGERFDLGKALACLYGRATGFPAKAESARTRVSAELTTANGSGFSGTEGHISLGKNWRKCLTAERA
jgi:hypothetical protein